MNLFYPTSFPIAIEILKNFPLLLLPFSPGGSGWGDFVLFKLFRLFQQTLKQGFSVKIKKNELVKIFQTFKSNGRNGLKRR